METNPKSTRAGKQLPEKKEKVYSTKYHAVKAREWRENNPEACTASGCRLPRLEGKSLCEHHRDGNYINMQKSRDARKLKVLTHYGKDGTLQCFWEGCTVCDPDMLSLDHKNDDGSIARKSGYDGCGDGLYRAVIREGYPEEFQTLCHNHQWKKEIMRRHSLRISVVTTTDLPKTIE